MWNKKIVKEHRNNKNQLKFSKQKILKILAS